MEKQISAVEWLCNEWLYIDQEFDLMLIDKNIYWEKLRAVQEQAKAMEKEQIIEACIQTTQDCWNSLSEEFGVKLNFTDDDLNSQKLEAEQYYNETFKSE